MTRCPHDVTTRSVRYPGSPGPFDWLFPLVLPGHQGRLGNDRDRVVGAEDPPGTGPHHRLVVGEHHPDHPLPSGVGGTEPLCTTVLATSAPFAKHRRYT